MKQNLRKQWDEIPEKGLFPDEVKFRMWKKIKAATTNKTRHQYKWIAAASIVLILSFTGYLTLLNTNKVADMVITQTYAQDIRLLLLPDGTRVWVNENTKIEYPKAFTGNTRNVTLKGEAFFEVKKDPSKPFIISSGLIQTTVLGTSFNIKAYEGHLPLVKVRTGRVKVENKNNTVLLQRGDAAVYMSTSELLVKQKADDIEPAYVKALIDIDGLSLNEAIKKLQKEYSFNIEYPSDNLKNLKLKGTLDTRQGIKGMLETLAFALNAEIIENTPGNYIISQ
ncbi:FecR family protein [Flavobacterium cerinum]|uniref:FecR family protein n=1 Tax=Flavobacterium cerinum TaxID=2502784 RepID=A0A444GLU6_9FLAO|nr:FecR family protein [Flavobacterium cerinum]RWW91943.1 FecR family protein [Flavobacterium cerinum]